MLNSQKDFRIVKVRGLGMKIAGSLHDCFIRALFRFDSGALSFRSVSFVFVAIVSMAFPLRSNPK